MAIKSKLLQIRCNNIHRGNNVTFMQNCRSKEALMIKELRWEWDTPCRKATTHNNTRKLRDSSTNRCDQVAGDEFPHEIDDCDPHIRRLVLPSFETQWWREIARGLLFVCLFVYLFIYVCFYLEVRRTLYFYAVKLGNDMRISSGFSGSHSMMIKSYFVRAQVDAWNLSAHHSHLIEMLHAVVRSIDLDVLCEVTLLCVANLVLCWGPSLSVCSLRCTRFPATKIPHDLVRSTVTPSWIYPAADAIVAEAAMGGWMS